MYAFAFVNFVYIFVVCNYFGHKFYAHTGGSKSTSTDY